MTTPPRLTPEDLAHRWQRSIDWVRQHAREFGGFKIGGLWRFNPDDIDNYENRHKTADPLRMTTTTERRRAS